MTFQKRKSSTSENSQDKLAVISQLVCYRIHDLMEKLSLDLKSSGKRYVGCCPVHGGDNFAALNLYPDGYRVPGFWKCRTHHCELIFKRTIIGFVRGVLSHQRYNWTKATDGSVSFPDTLDWLCNFLGQKLKDIRIDPTEVERKNFQEKITVLSKTPQQVEKGLPRAKVRENLLIPATYYLERGFSRAILDSYDVGYCKNSSKEMFGRVVVPIYDKAGNNMVGCTGRSIFKQCEACKAYHEPQGTCPEPEYRWLASKWRHSKNFNTSSYLYNLWRAGESIKSTGVILLVEGPGDVWKLEENGIHNSVALFGCELTDEQQVLLETSGAMSVVLLLDKDKAGEAGIGEIVKRLRRSYHLDVPTLPCKDPGELTATQMQECLIPIINKLSRRFK
jgi:5S rRNA maturation endonuclease (ribonuclease M5)